MFSNSIQHFIHPTRDNSTCFVVVRCRSISSCSSSLLLLSSLCLRLPSLKRHRYISSLLSVIIILIIVVLVILVVDGLKLMQCTSHGQFLTQERFECKRHYWQQMTATTTTTTAAAAAAKTPPLITSTAVPTPIADEKKKPTCFTMSTTTTDYHALPPPSPPPWTTTITNNINSCTNTNNRWEKEAYLLHDVDHHNKLPRTPTTISITMNNNHY